MANVQQTFERMVEQGYRFEWWAEWTEEDWAQVTPAQEPTFAVENG